MIDHDNLTLIKDFKDLKRKDKVYSAKFGLGEVKSLYRDDEVIVSFTGRTERISLADSDLKLIPLESVTRKKATSIMTVNGVKMGRRKMIKFMRDSI